MTLKPQTRRLIAWAAGLLGLLALAGCQHQTKVDTGDDFAPMDDSASVRQIATAQQATAARRDGMLYDNHFDGGHLNSLGEHKLSLMLKDGEKDWPLVVYMDVPEDGDYRDRITAVSNYLRDAGLRDVQFRFEQGPNPHYSVLAGPNIQHVKDSESGADLSSRPGSGGAYGPTSSTPAPAAPSGPPAGAMGDIK